MTHKIRILDISGHTELEYSPTDLDSPELKAAEEAFNRAVTDRRMLAVDASVHPNKKINAFDPTLSEIILLPQFTGG